MIKALTKLPHTICRPHNVTRQKRNECPTAAINAQYLNVTFGGLLIEAKPIAAIAANIASSRIFSNVSIFKIRSGS